MPLSVQSIPLSWALRQCNASKAAGLPIETLFRSAMITPEHGDDRDRVSPTQLLLLDLANIAGVEDESQGFGRKSVALGVGYLGLTSMVGCETLGVGLNALCSVFRLATNTVRMKVNTELEQASISVELSGRRQSDARFFEDSLLTWLFMCVSYFIGRPAPIATLVTRDSRHFNLRQLHWACRVPVRLGSVSELRFCKQLLVEPRRCRRSDNPMVECMNLWLDCIEGEYPVYTSRFSSSAGMTLSTMVAKTGLSDATLRRRFKAAEGGFRVARQRELCQAGVYLLRTSQESVDEIANQLGYANSQSFRRMIKTNTGRTPQAIRGSVGDSEPSRIELRRRVHTTVESLVPRV